VAEDRLFQWQRIDPTADEVEGALAEAAKAAKLRQPTTRQRRDAWAHAEQSSGLRAWGPERRPGQPFRHVSCAWWSDHLGRRHWFVEGDEYLPHGEPNPLWRCPGGTVAHPLCIIDPLHTAVRGEGPERACLVVCDCGVVGTPESLGWTGDCCAPCFDRRAEGTVQPARVAVHAHRTAVSSLAFTGKDRVLSLGYRDGAIHLFNSASGENSLLASDNRGGAGVVSLPGGAAAVAFGHAEVVCWELESGEHRWRTHCPGELMGLAVSPRGDRLAVDAVSQPYLLDAETGSGEALSDDLSNFAFGPDGSLFAYDYGSRGIVVVDVLSGETTETGLEFGEPEEDDCYALACSPALALVAAGCTGGVVRVGDPAMGRWLHTFQRPASIVSELAFAPDGRVLASGHNERVMFWDVRTGAEVGTLALPLAGVSALAFGADGELLAVGDEQGVVRLWPWGRLLGGLAGVRPSRRR
jgi:hypothetical protein